MDISSGNVDFGQACPGTLMQELLLDQPEQMRKITKFQTSFSQTEKFMLCPLPCEDLAIFHTFITSISALEELSVLNYEPDGSSLWPAVLHHASSLRSLSIHTPPYHTKHNPPKTWTADIISTLASSMPNLKHLELDIPLSEAESFLASLTLEGRVATRSSTMSHSQISTPVIDAVFNHLPHLESIQMTIPTYDEASSFSDKRIYDHYGCKSFPQPERQVCETMAAALLERFQPAGTMKKLTLRLTRLKIYDDRCQFYPVAHCTTAVREEDERIAVEAENTWGEDNWGYLPSRPGPNSRPGQIDPGSWCRLMDEYRS